MYLSHICSYVSSCAVCMYIDINIVFDELHCIVLYSYECHCIKIRELV